MQGKTKERWLELCERAAVEQDHEELIQLIAEISELLAEKEERLKIRRTEIPTMAKCICSNDLHGHGNPCGQEAGGTEHICSDCAKKSAKEFAETQEVPSRGKPIPIKPIV